MRTSPVAVSVEPSPTAAGAGFRVDAPAKVNLFLHVTGRRGDGYHELEGLVAFAAICDRIEVRPAERLEFETGGPFAAKLDPRAENLAVRAARALAEAAGIAPDARIRLHKALPVAAGLGGGSADAAAVLRALAALWDVTLPGDALAALALRLGADVPVCLAARPSMVRGIGERIDAAPALPTAPILLVNPAVPLATAAVFAAREGPFSKPRRFDAALPDVPALAAALSETGNDLAPGARRLCPDIDAMLEAIGTSPSCLLARLTGSGPTCFGLFPAQDHADRAAARIAAARPRWWVRSTRLHPS
ncbi:MAG: 4-(cytidine 5'-diphospho)-2-C-methyl-D-erythritol kinase [Defluviicoccus sp.]|nr:4-(cytidine 5'-diphospho)-2-C-methyl-D-erythritol kinase [Defluviicoccus sp.]MDE0383445.1 4-(cytidine 5'-diphospho)-2-C-methyl-D-erythritol kinase [Defluviicoccus sp.]